MIELRRHLVPPHRVAGAARDFAHVVQSKRQQHRFLEPLIDPPGAACLTLGDAGGAAVEQVERLLDRFAHRALGGRADLIAPLEGGVDGRGQMLGGPG